MGATDRRLFGRQLRKCRELAKITQEKLGHDIGLSDGSGIGHYESGKALPPQERLDAIIHVLREHGAPRECLEKLYEYSGYTGEGVTNPTLTRIARVLDGLSQLPSARRLLEETLTSVIQDWERYYNALTDLQRGSMYWWDAQQGFQKLLPDTSSEIPHRERLRIRVLQGLAHALRYRGEATEGIKFLHEAVMLAERLGKLERETLTEVLLQRGNFHRRLNNWDKARDDYYKSSRIAKDIEYTTGEKQDRTVAIVERKLAGTHLFQGQPRKALHHCESSLIICKDLPNPDEEWKAQQHMAWAYAMLGRWGDALKIHKDVVKALDSQGASFITRAKGLRYLADTYRMCGLLGKAEENYDKALNNLVEFHQGEVEKDLLVYGMILLGKGAVYRAHPSIERSRAKQHLEKSLDSHLKLKARFHEALSRSELGRLALESDDFREATRQLNRAKDIFDEIGNAYYAVATLVNFADLECRRGSHSKAREYATNAIFKAEEHDYLVHYVRAQLRLAEVSLKEPDEKQPIELYLSAIRQAYNLNPYLLHEVLCRVADQPRALDDENSAGADSLRLCDIITKEWEELVKSQGYPESSLQEWLGVISQLQTDLERSLNSGATA